MQRIHALGFIAALAVATSARAQDPPSYHATLLDDMVETVFPDVQWPSSWSTGLNENGDVVGQAMLNYDPNYGSRMQAFLYTVEHGVVAIPLAPGWGSNAVLDVSDRDENGEIIIVGGGVVGPFIDLSIGEAALWRYSTVTGTFIETRLLGIPSGFDDSIAVAVNNSGTIAGYSGLTGSFTNWKYDVASGVQETFDFPARVKDMNNVGQVCGGAYRGDLFGNYEDLTDSYEPGDVMPQWAIDNGGISAGWNRINDQGWVVGRAATGISDGAGHFLVAIVRYADPIGWVGFPPVSHLSMPGGINDHGDFTTAYGGVYLEDTGQTHGLSQFVAPEWQPLVIVGESPEINDNRQVIGGDDHSWLLTPMGEMIIPGDVNGDVEVNLDDYCAWVAAPIDLNGDGIVDEDDHIWLIARLLDFGHVVTDCNGNGIGDHCDILEGTSLDCDLNGVPDECQDDCNGDGVPDVCEPDCNGNGVPDPCDIDQGTSTDCNGNGIPDECDVTGGVTDVEIVYDTPVFMYPDETIVENILVVDAGIVEDVDVMLNYRYRIGYTKVELSHNGTTVTILDRPGHPEYANGFVNFGYDTGIVNDDTAGPYLEDTGDHCCNFESIVSPPHYRPNEPLSAFDGMPSEGVWTLTMTTTPDSSAGDGIHAWGFTITRASVSIPPCCPADFVTDGFVDVADLLYLINAWNKPDADIDGDGTTGTADLLILLSDWGPCE